MVEFIKNTKEIWTLVAAVSVATIGILTWAGDNFVTIASAEILHNDLIGEMVGADKELADELRKTNQQILSLSKQVEESNHLLNLHMNKHELEQAVQSIRATEAEIFSLEQFMRVNGSDSRSEDRLRKLKSTLKELEIQRECIITNNPLCG